MKAYKDREISKDILTQTLHAFQTSNNKMKSKDREDACEMIARHSLQL